MMNSVIIEQIIKDSGREKILRASIVLSNESMHTMLEKAYAEAGDPLLTDEENATNMITWIRNETIYFVNAL